MDRELFDAAQDGNVGEIRRTFLSGADTSSKFGADEQTSRKELRSQTRRQIGLLFPSRKPPTTSRKSRRYLLLRGSQALVFFCVLFTALINRKLILFDDGASVPNNKIYYAIPPRLIFTYRSNLLRQQNDSSDVIDRRILANVQKTISMYKERDGTPIQIMFLSNDDCIEQIESLDDEQLGALQSDFDSKALLEYFKAESTPGAIKGDICRGVVLYKFGGYYLDVDVIPHRVPLWELVNSTVDFVTARNAPWPPAPQRGKRLGGFFQAIWAVRPLHPVTLRYLSLYVSHIKTNPTQPYYGVHALEEAYNQVLKQMPSVLDTSLLMDEGWLEDGKDLNVPRLNGTGCCCHAVVRVGSAVAFYSRAPGTGGSNSCQAL